KFHRAHPLAPQEVRTFFATSLTFERRLILQSKSLCDLLLDVFRDNRSKGRRLLHEFVIMRNHFHAILTPAPETPLERAMQFLKGGFSYRQERIGNEVRDLAERIQRTPDQGCRRLSRPCGIHLESGASASRVAARRSSLLFR